MSCDIDSDSFHGTKAGQARRSAVKAYRIKSRISRSLKFIRKELDRLYRDGKVPQEDYNILRTCLSHYKEYMTVDKRYKI